MNKRSDIGYSVPLLLGRVGVGFLLLLGLAGCKTTQAPPIDDAYYWPDQTTPSTPTTQIAPSTPTTQTAPSTPAMEIVNQQDTTITVRIKR